jgi:hypothetical protein
MTTTGFAGREGSNGDLARNLGSKPAHVTTTVIEPEASGRNPAAGLTLHPDAPDTVTSSERKPGSLSWTTGLITSTTLFGALYLILYQAAREFYRHNC